jgi:hypothetical protein
VAKVLWLFTLGKRLKTLPSGSFLALFLVEISNMKAG